MNRVNAAELESPLEVTSVIGNLSGAIQSISLIYSTVSTKTMSRSSTHTGMHIHNVLAARF